MDYKYINQLLERYWRGETSLEEEEILRAFFSQQDVPEEFAAYKSYFSYLQQEKQVDQLGDDFDSRVLSELSFEPKVRAHKVSLRDRLMPLFKAAAVVAILLTLGNAVQMAVDDSAAENPVATDTQVRPTGPSMAKADTVRLDTARQSVMLAPQPGQMR